MGPRSDIPSQLSAELLLRVLPLFCLVVARTLPFVLGFELLISTESGPRGSRISGKLLCSQVNEAADDVDADPVGDGSGDADSDSELALSGELFIDDGEHANAAVSAVCSISV